MQIILLTLQALKYTSTVFPYTYTVNIQPISPETSNISNIKTPPKIVIRWKKMHISFILDPRRASDHTLTISTYTRSKTYLKYPLVSNITRENRINDRIESNIFIEYLHVLTNNPTARDDCPPNLLNSHHRYEAWNVGVDRYERPSKSRLSDEFSFFSFSSFEPPSNIEPTTTSIV